MNCKEIQELMWCGEITPDVRAHLETCERCRTEQATLQELGIAVESVEIPRPSRSLLPARAEIEAVIRTQKRRRFTKWLSAGAVAACLALAVTQVPALLHKQQGQTPVDVTQPNDPNAPKPFALEGVPTEQIKQLLNKYQFSAKVDERSWTRSQIAIPNTYRGSSEAPNFGLYFDYVNVLSKDIGLGLQPALGQNGVDVYIVPLQEPFAGGRADGPSESEGIFLVWNSKVIGGWQRQVTGQQMASLSNKLFGEITKQSWGEWLQAEQLETYAPERVQWKPEEVIAKYFDAYAKGEYATCFGLFSQSYVFNRFTTNVEPNQLYNASFGGPIPVTPTAKLNIQFREDVPADQFDSGTTSLFRNRKFAEMKTYQVDGAEQAIFVTLVRETAKSPWQIDNIATGP